MLKVGVLCAVVAQSNPGRTKTKTKGLAVSARVILTHFVGVKLTHLGEDGGLLAAADVDSGASSGRCPAESCNIWPDCVPA